MTHISLQTKGAALLLFVLLFLGTSTSLIITIGSGVFDEFVRYRVFLDGKRSLLGAEAGIEDALYRHRNGSNYSNSETFTFASSTVETARTVIDDAYHIVSEGGVGDAVRRNEAVLVIGGGASFGFGIQSGNGGFTLANSSAVYGNVFSNHSVTGANNYVYGDIIVAGASGLVQNIHATGSVWAHTITGGSVGVDAYYDTITGTIVSGSACTGGNIHCHPGSEDQVAVDMPISDEQIDEWKVTAEAGGILPLTSCSGGVATGTYTIDTDMTIGPLKIPCNLSIEKNNTDLTLSGPVWVVGNISTANGPIVKADPAFPGKGGILIADNEGNRTTSSKVSIQGSTGFNGSGNSSYMLLVSMNESSFLGGSEVAIDINNQTPPDSREVIYYAPYGKLVGGNSLLLRGATANQISLLNSATVYYETGLLNPLFSGTGGTYTVYSWKEIP